MTSLKRILIVATVASALTVPASAGADGEPGSFDRYSYTNSAGTRWYKVFVPPNYDGSPLPLLVDLHGCGSNADEESRWSRFNEVGAARDFFVVYPEQASSANGSLCWNWFLSDNHSRDAGEPSIIAGITRTVIHRWNIEPRRVWVAGISAGGAMSDIMAVTYPDLYAAAMVYAGCEYKGTTCKGGLAALPPEISGQLAYEAMGDRARVVPVFVIQGDADVVVPAPNAEFVVQQFLASDDWADDGQNNGSISRARSSTQSGAKPGGRSYDIDYYTDSNGCLLAERWLIHGMGHAWSNATPNETLRDALLTDPLGPDVTTPTYQFLRAHPMPKKGTGCFQLRMKASGLER